MPRNTTLNILPKKVTELTANEAAVVSLVNCGDQEVWLFAIPALDYDPVTPPEFNVENGWLKLRGDEGVNDPLADIWRGVTDPVRLYAYSAMGTSIFVSHA